MKTTIAVSIMTLVISATSFAAASKSVPAIFHVNGKIVSAQEALMAASEQKEVYKCTQVELKPSKSGTSFSLRNKKAQ